MQAVTAAEKLFKHLKSEIKAVGFAITWKKAAEFSALDLLLPLIFLSSECGLVLESHSNDETSEWRTLANESGDYDPVRVGGPSNPLLTDGGLSTVISKPNGVTSDFLSSSLGRWRNRDPNRSLILAFKTIATVCGVYK
ncbi:hypothetical protein C3L33_09431, partial [Rhododendron williamsianum]